MRTMDGIVKAARSRLNNVPIVKTTNAIKEGCFERDSSARQRKFASTMKQSCVGPMPLEEFLEAFLPSRPDNRKKQKGRKRMPQARNAFRSVPKEASDESEIYEPLVSCLTVSIQAFVDCRSSAMQSIQGVDVRHSNLLRPLTTPVTDDVNL